MKLWEQGTGNVLRESFLEFSAQTHFVRAHLISRQGT